MIRQLQHAGYEQAARVLAPLRKHKYPAQARLFNEFREQDAYAIIVLDALSYDYAHTILPQYFEGDLTETWSAAHDTFEYGQRVWGDRVYDDVTYVSGAVPLNSEAHEFENDHFNQLYGGWRPSETMPGLVDAWRDCWDTSLGAVPPEDLTRAATPYLDDDRVVVHYGQPHAPYIGQHSYLGHTDTRDAEPNQGAPVDEPVWEAVKRGDITPHDLRVAYQSNTHRVCASVVGLIESLDDRPVVITADHGELLADHGVRSLVSHPRVPFESIRCVPWMLVDSVRHYPRGSDGDSTGGGVAAKLEALGYRQ